MSKPRKKIIITGPESSGKSTLAKLISQHYACPYIPEYARSYLDGINRAYDFNDLLKIAEGQDSRIEWMRPSKSNLLVCDTDKLVMHVWATQKFNKTVAAWLEAIKNDSSSFYLLARPDLSWQPDPLRENPDDRTHLFQIYENHLKKLDKPYFIVEGTGWSRFDASIDAVDQFLSQSLSDLSRG